MNLGELKRSLAKYPPDMDDLPVAGQFSKDGEDLYDLLCFVGYTDSLKHPHLIIGFWSAVDKMVKDGKIDPPEGFTDFPGF